MASIVRLVKKATIKVITALFSSSVIVPSKSFITAVQHILVNDSIGVRSVVNS